MKKNRILASTLIAASFALSVPAWATDYTFSGSAGSISLGDYNSDDTLIFSNVTSGYFYGSGSGSYTCAANIIINATDQSTNNNGLTLNDGASDSTYTFTGSISGSGNWTFNKSSTSQQYTFLGDMSGYSGNIDYSTERESSDHPSYFHFGNGGTAATDTNVSGTGSITQHGNITFNYSGYATYGDSAITIGNSSLKAEAIEFTGSVNYTVSSTTVTGYDTNSTLTISNAGTTTFTGTVSGFGTVTVASGSTLAVASGGSLDLTGATVDLTSTIQNSGTVTIAGTSFVLDNLTSGSSGNTDYYIIVSGTGTISYSGNASFTYNGITLSWEVYNSGGYFVVYGDHISDLTWAGTSDNNTWSTTSTDTPWSSSEGTTENSGFNNGDSVTFSSSTAEKSVIVSGAVEAASMTVSAGGYTFSSDTTNGGTIKTSSLTFKVARGETMTIAVSEADLGAVSISRLDSGETTGDDYRVLTIGGGTTTTTATASSLTLLGASEISVAKDSKLTVTGNVDFNGGYSENVSGDGTLIVKGTATHATGGTLSISVANFQADTFTKTSSANTIFSGTATIGTFNAASGSGSTKNTITLTDGATLTVGELTNAWGANFVLGEDSLLDVTSANFSTGSEGYSVSGTGTFKAETFTFANVSNYTFSGITLNVGTFSVTAGNSLTFTDVNSTIGSLSISSTAPVTFTGGTTKIGSLSVGGNNGSISFSGGSVDIDSIDLEYGSITFTGEGTYNIGSYVNSPASDGWTNNSKTFAIGDNATVTVGTFSSSWHETVTFGENSVLTVTGELSLHTASTEEFKGGTINAGTLNIYNYTTASFSNGALNIGEGGIISNGNNGGWSNCSVTFGDDLTVGVYAGADGTNTSWSTDATIQFTTSTGGSGTTFYTETGQSITLSGDLSGAAFSNEGSGSLTLSGTVALDGAISNSGTIIVDTSSVVFNLDNLTETSDGTYVVITGGGTITNWSELDASNFSYSGGTITHVDVTTDGQVTISTEIRDLIWNTSDGSGNWDTSTANWTSDSGATSVTFGNGDYVTFTKISEDKATVTVQDAGVTAGSVTVEGGTYSFAGGNITVNTTFTIGTGAEVDLDGSVVTADFVVNGTLKLDLTAGSGGTAGQTGEVHGTITINDGGRVELDDGDVTGYNNGAGVTQITINKGGTLYVGTTENQTLGGCELVLVGGTIDGVSGSNIDLFHSSSKITVLAESGASADNPTVSTVTNVMLTPRNTDNGTGPTEVFVDENAKLVVESGFWSGPGGGSSYNGSIEKTGAGTLEVSGYFAIDGGSLIIDAGTVILSGYAGGTSNNYGFASAVTVAEGALLNMCFSGDTSLSGVTFSGAGTIEVSGEHTLTIESSTFSGANTIVSNGTLTVSGSTFSGTNTFEVSDENTLTISDSTFSGSTTVSEGTLVLTGETILGGSAEIHVETGATLDLTGVTKTQTEESAKLDVLYIEGGTVIVENYASGWGGRTTNFGSAMYNGMIQISNGGVLEVTAAQVTTQGVESAYRAFAVTEGEGTYRYTGEGTTYITKDTTATNRHIHLGNEATLIFDVVDSNATLDVSMVISYGLETTDSIGTTSSGSLVKTGAGTLILEAANNYSGGTTIKEGVLVAASSGALGSGEVKIEGGAQLSVSSGVEITNAISVTLSEAYQCVNTPSPTSAGSGQVATYANGEDGIYAITGDGGTLNTTITLFIDETIAELLADAGEAGLAFYLVDTSGVTEGDGFTVSLSEALSGYTYTYDTDTGILWVAPIPEPELFSIFFGLGALGLVATRRRRRAA